MSNQVDFKLYNHELIVMSGKNVIATNESALEMWKDHIIGLTGEFFTENMINDWMQDLEDIAPKSTTQKESVNERIIKHRYGK